MYKPGSIVERGENIALTGNSGELTVGPHLHYEVKKEGIALNPKDFIFDDVNLTEITELE